MSDKPTTVAVATYADKNDCDVDYKAVLGVKEGGELDHIAVSKVHKDADGKLKVHREDSTAKHLGWAGGIIGGVLTVLVPPAGIGFLAVNTAAGAAAGWTIGHFWHNIPKGEVEKMSNILDAGEWGLVMVAVNPAGTDVGALLENAVDKHVVDDVADADGELEKAFQDLDA